MKLNLAVKQQKFETIRKELLNFRTSPLYKYRVKNNYQIVPGSGNLNASIMFIGEAPGKNEAISGKPFVGAAGRILDELLASINLSKSDVFITSLLQDRPPNNRDPRPEEIEIYSPFLFQIINIIQPKAICPLGRFAMTFIMNQFGLTSQIKSIGQIHGKVFKAKAEFGEVTIIPLYHPAFAIYQQSQKQLLLDDFKKIPVSREL